MTEPEQDSPDKVPVCLSDVGVVVIGRNEGARLIACLKSVSAATAQIIYVDSGSTDGSADAAERLRARVVQLDLSRPFTAARARNEGLAALKTAAPDVRYVQFIDGDCELVEGWLAAARTFLLQHEAVAVVCGRRRERHPEASVYNRLCDVEWDTPIGEASACGGDAMFRTEAFESVGGFAAQLIAGEEPELCLRLRESGWKIWRLDAEMTRHDAAMTRFRQWWTRAVRSGYGMTEVYLFHRSSRFAVWRREIARAIFWGGALPLAIIVGAVIYPPSSLALLIYPLQLARIAVTHASTLPNPWIYGVFMVMVKFAELQGILKFCLRHWSARPSKLIEYK